MVRAVMELPAGFPTSGARLWEPRGRKPAANILPVLRRKVFSIRRIPEGSQEFWNRKLISTLFSEPILAGLFLLTL
jgi:hypothetical protein